MRGIYSALGAKVEWNEAERKVTASLGSKVVKLRIGSRTALVDEKRQLLDEKVMLVNATTMVPVRFISESLGAKVDWLAETNTVAITTVP
ncbi:copper amine oxidase N-terminal domain-containing protein [Paenibacillus sp. FSL H8-0034]|uniref:copper amine oxidase N-terminal domain-containing protein n=1 Tax=Paenibacillus sp. FSL H8-0034 TaxID=2954671 RepID=UPI004046E9D1